MDGKGRRLLVALAVVLVATMSARAAPVPSTEEADGGQHNAILTIKPATFAGTIVYSDGKTPAAEVPVRVWGVEKKEFVHDGATDKQGAFELPALAEGRYIAVFADRMRLDLVVDGSKGKATESLKVVIPRGKAEVTREQVAKELARVGPVYPAGGSSRPLQYGGWSWLANPWVISGIVATAVAVPVAIHNSDRRSRVASP